MDNIESWSRTRRASGHSISVSSESRSLASSAGPSSFTDNLTLYMNGEREPHLSSPEALPTELSSANIDGEDGASANGVIQSLREKVQVTLRDNENLQAENARLRDELKSVSEKFSKPSGEDILQNRSKERDEADSNRLEVLRAENEELKAKLEASISIADTDKTATDRLKEMQDQVIELNERLEITRLQAEVHSMRVNELEADLEQQLNTNKTLREQGSAHKHQLQLLEHEIESRDGYGKDELDDQSLIEELEDDLERTRHELERVVRDKERAERQLEFVRSDLNFEKSRNEDLEEQVSHARSSASRSNVVSSTDDRIKEHKNDSDDQSHEHIHSTPAELRELRSSLERTTTKMESLEAIISSSSMNLNSSQKPKSTAVVPSTPANDRKKFSEGTETPMDRAEAYIRKLKDQERLLNEDIRSVCAERDHLRLSLRDSEDVRRDAEKEIVGSQKRIKELEDVKSRMGRVLMYQWGKEEVGTIERNAASGKREKGMGYRYKYFNKDGTSKGA